MDDILRYRHLIPRLDVKPCPAGYLLIASVNISTQDPEHVFVPSLLATSSVLLIWSSLVTSG